MEKHKQLLKDNHKMIISEIPENGEELDEDSIKLIRTFNTMEEFDYSEHDQFYENSISFVKEEIELMREKIFNTQLEINNTYKELNKY